MNSQILFQDKNYEKMSVLIRYNIFELFILIRFIINIYYYYFRIL